jgi:cellulose synthase/poly-beta-1,6-N-acetylglucosamine synthase-like glycosyltransferase
VTIFISILAAIGAALLSLPVAVFVLEIIFATTFRAQKRSALPDAAISIAVVVPAHNESSNIIPTLLDLKKQLKSTDRLIVVADNCSDDTATVAIEAGAEVLRRDDPAKVGKGYALDWAIRSLHKNPPEVVIFVDADCRVADRTVDELAAACIQTSRPAQGLNLMTASATSKINYQVAEFAWLVSNFVRPAGLHALGLPCQLTGTGMAFPWNVVRRAAVASGEIVEDLKLGLDLALAGFPARFCPSACVTSTFPLTVEGSASQRERWEKGHIRTIVSSAPSLLVQAVARRNLSLLVLTLDLTVPPLSLLGLLLIGCLVITALVVVAGGSAVALSLSIINAVGFGFAIFLSWIRFGKDVLPAGSLAEVPFFVLRKLPLYRRIFTGKPTAKWIRTDRDAGPSSPPRNGGQD